jgi:hypothetical protein
VDGAAAAGDGTGAWLGFVGDDLIGHDDVVVGFLLLFICSAELLGDVGWFG